MNIAVCISKKETAHALLQLLERYQEERRNCLSFCFFSNDIDLLCDYVGGEYDVLFFDGVQRSGMMEEIRQIDRQIRLIYIAAEGANIGEHGKDLWYCLSEPLSALFLFPVLDRLISDVRKSDEAGITIKTKGTVTHLAFSRIEYAEVMGKTVYFHLSDGDTEEVAGSFSDFETRLLQWPDFVKVHRSYIINLRCIEKLTAGCIKTKSGDTVPVSKHLYPQFKKDYLCRLMDPAAQQDSVEEDFYTAQQESAKEASSAADPDPANPYSVLLVDDEESERLRWSKVLTDKGCIVHTADHGEAALFVAGQVHFDCVVLDVNLGASSGFDLCGALREKTGAPVIFLSSLTSSENQVKGFMTGGIDYITKDTQGELFWLKTETRIKMARSEKSELFSGPLLLDLKERKAFLHGQALSLTTVEFDLLCLLMQNPGSVYTPSHLYELIWGSRQWDDGHTVQLHLSQLHRKLENAFPGHRFIETVWGKGYRFVPAKDPREDGMPC